MALHHRNGDGVKEPKEWIDEQIRLVRQWNLPEYEHISEEEKVKTWISFFSRWARMICNDENVDVETFEALFEVFEDNIMPDIEEMKYAMSERAGRNIGLEKACKAIAGKINKVIRNGYPYLDFHLTFPIINRTQTLRLPIL
jgi:hypothetical protein